MVPFTVNKRAAVFIPDDGEKLVILGPMLALNRLKQFSFVTFGPPGFVTVRLYRPAVDPARANVPVNFKVVNPDTLPGIVVLPFTSDTESPCTNFDPDILIGIELVLNPVDGERVVIFGGGLVTVKASGLIHCDPSELLTIKVYNPIGSPVSGNEHLTRVAVTDVAGTDFVVVSFVIVTVAPERKFVPLITNARNAVFNPVIGE